MSDLLLTVQASGIRSVELRPSKLFIYNDRMVFEDKGLISRKESTISYSQVAQVNIRRGLLHTTLEVVNTGGAQNIKLEHVGNDTALKAKTLIDSKIQELHSSKTHTSNESQNPLEQLKKLGELQEKGVITKEEFEKKKSDLLSQI
ncbi:MAG: hypothetical protein A2Z42_02675 [Candidatus Woykebacteria bacterium RBG_19FT_COMBO_43_10]|uniref:SHOCT domain-containing protein n=1 Tax=Candidatus Woykebacteria bacterium RBG_19FT_COMBO_43_10 TaxID=1802598 RepID=A0A1G1WJ29_9BACT|nr:MAG: hypothetical protein A2Z42_02675 [Candidatus Woykebacteria bacterium RBG_19FT_COMBO_43_10]